MMKKIEALTILATPVIFLISIVVLVYLYFNQYICEDIGICVGEGIEKVCQAVEPRCEGIMVSTYVWVTLIVILISSLITIMKLYVFNNTGKK